MATTAYTYDALLQSMKNRFTVVDDSCEYTLGGYMRAKAAEHSGSHTLPVAVTHGAVIVPMRRFVNTVKEKLTLKEVPTPERALTSFPLRTALSSMAAALVLCTMLFSFGRIGALWTSSSDMPATRSAECIVSEVDGDTTEPIYEVCSERM